MKKTNAIMILVLVMLSAVSTAFAVSYETPTQQSIRIKNTRYDPFPVEPGAYFDLWIRVENFGATDVTNFKFKLSPDYPFSLDPNEDALREYGRLSAGEQALFNFKVRTDVNAVQGNNPLKYEYMIGGAKWNEAQLNVNVHTADAVLAVDDVVFDKETISPGDTTSVDIKLKNMADSTIKDIKVKLNLIEVLQTTATFNVRELPISPVGSSDEKTIRTMKGGEEESINFDLIVDSSAESKVYKIPLTITYSDLQGTNYSKNNMISLVVGSEPDLAINVDSSTANMAGKAGEVVIKFVNKGFSEIKFLYVTLEETDAFELLSPSEVYLGNVDSDDYESAEYKIYVRGNGDSLDIPLTIDYRDAGNKHYNEKIVLNTRIYSSSEAKKFGIVKGGSGIGFVIVVVIVVGGYFLYKKFRKKKKKKQ